MIGRAPLRRTKLRGIREAMRAPCALRGGGETVDELRAVTARRTARSFGRRAVRGGVSTGEVAAATRTTGRETAAGFRGG